MLNKINLLIRHYIRNATSKTQKFFTPFSNERIYDIESLLHLQHYNCNRLPWTQSAMRPSALQLCLNEIEIHKKINVIELGSGISTIFIANLLKKLGGKLITFDHNKEWQELVATRCLDCKDCISFITISLKEISINGANFQWYDSCSMANHAKIFKPDLLLVDGPIGIPNKMARYPALPVLKNYLADDFTIFLDDINRRDELLTAHSWAHEYNLNLSVIYSRGNVGVLRPKNTYSKYNIF